MKRLEVSGAVRPIYGSLGVKRLIFKITQENCGSRPFRNVGNLAYGKITSKNINELIIHAYMNKNEIKANIFADAV